MVQKDVAINLIQLVALSLPAFAILLELMVESDFPYANRAVTVIAISFGFVLFGGVIIISTLLLTPLTLLLRSALVLITIGFFVLTIGILLIGLRMRQAQEKAAE